MLGQQKELGRICSDIPSLSASDSCVSTVPAAFGSELAGPLE